MAADDIYASALAGLDPQARALIARDARLAHLKAGQKVFSPGQACSAFLLVKTGSVRVSTVTESGRELLLYRVGPAETCVLTTACLLASADYDAEGVAEADTDALAIPKPAFEELLAQSAAFRRFVFSSYGERLRDLIGLVQEVSQRHVDRRLARFLVDRGASGPIAATHQDIATELNTAREVISRLLKNFEAEGLVRLERRQIVITDSGKLAALHG
jgi:CRP/FNR family transcriptional regulator, anaerobic regulatory protein